MKDLLKTLASQKLAIGVLVLLLLALGAGTIVETLRGAEEAGRTVYRSWWLFGLLQLLFASVLASAYLHYPWGKQRWGYAATHLGVALVLFGAGVTYRYGTDGDLVIWKGETANEVVKRDPQGKIRQHARLPFYVQLDDFRIENYPGTERPANYRSEVQIVDLARGAFGASIWMNHGLSHQGWDFYQSSYRFEEDGRVASVLSASSDPGRLWVFCGYCVLLAGMGGVIGTRISQHRKVRVDTAKDDNPLPDRLTRVIAAAILFAVIGGVFYSTHNNESDPRTEALRRLPVQHDGRVMPFDTLARESILRVTGRTTWHDADPVNTALDWFADAEKTSKLPIVKFGPAELALAMGLSDKTPYISVLEFENRLAHLRKLFEDGAAKGDELPRLRSAVAELEERLQRLQSFIRGDILRTLPPSPESDTWTPPVSVQRADLLALASGPRLPHWPSASSIEHELTYNRVQPTRLSWIVLAGAFLLAALGWLRKQRWVDHLALGGLVLGTAMMTWGLAVRWQIAGRIPASNMHESLLFLAWGVGFVALLLFPWMRNRIVLLNAAGVSALTMLLNNLLPIDAFIHPMPPVLAGTPWLAIHVPIIMLSYSILALGMVVAHAQLGVQTLAPARTATIENLYRTLYWYIHVGCWLLAAGIITGSIWAASSWGRYWGWDPKEVWSLVALLAYLAILHGRIEKIVGTFGVAAFSILAFQTILMTYLGVNFVLGTGMHSYAMGDSPVAKWMLLVAAVEGAFLFWVLAARKRRGTNTVNDAISPPIGDEAVP
jgi:cytochrome c-type biogenesis protein CcsB